MIASLPTITSENKHQQVVLFVYLHELPQDFFELFA